MKMNLNSQLQNIRKSVYSDPDILKVITDGIIDAEKSSVKGLLIGDKAPDFILPNTTHEYVSLYQQLGKGPVALVFFRGEWCPFCNLELQALENIYVQVRALGAQIITVHPQRISSSKVLSDKYNLSYQVLSDERQEVINDYKIKYSITPEVKKLFLNTFKLDLEMANANGMWNLPVPAAFIIDRGGIIKARHFSHDYTFQIEPTDIIAALKKLPEFSEEFIY